MSEQVDFNGEEHTLPSPREKGWGAAVTAFLREVAENALTSAFILAAEMDLGATYGIRSLWFRSKTSNPADGGVVRLARADTVAWRNQANGANLALGPDSTNLLEFNGVDLVDVSTAQTLTTKTLTAPVVAGGALSGTFTGAPTLSGNVIFSGAPVFSNLKDTTRAYAKATHSAGAAIPDSAFTIVDFATTVVDSRTAITAGASWKYTVPAGHGGIYLVSAVVTFNTGTATPMELSLNKNGSPDTKLATMAVQAGTQSVSLSGSTLISLAAGDYIDVRVLQTSGGSRSLVPDAKYNHIDIVRLVTDL